MMRSRVQFELHISTSLAELLSRVTTLDRERSISQILSSPSFTNLYFCLASAVANIIIILKMKEKKKEDEEVHTVL
jgi:hypothetical protein